MWKSIWESIIEAGTDSVKLLPFLFLTYLAMEILEHKAGEKTEKRIEHAGAFGPIWGSLLGVVPQCGFSAAASSLYAGRVITLGTLLAIYLSTSDEMLPIFISEAVGIGFILKVLGLKVVIGLIAGYVVDLLLVRRIKCEKQPMDIHTVCEEEHCKCEDGILSSALKHTLRIFFFILLISVVISCLVEWLGHDRLSMIFTDVPVVGEMIAALVGLIPNCAGSVVITQLYLEHIISYGAMMSGLLVSAGVGLLILFRLNRHHMRENLKIAGLLYVTGVVWGVIVGIFV